MEGEKKVTDFHDFDMSSYLGYPLAQTGPRSMPSTCLPPTSSTHGSTTEIRG